MNNPTLQQRIDQLMATSPQRVALSMVAVALVSAPSVALSIRSDADDRVLVALAVVFALGSVLQPDNHGGLATIAVVTVHWLGVGLPATSPWVLPVAGCLLAFHSLLAVMAVTPHTSDLPGPLLKTWLWRCVVVGVATVSLWGLVVLGERWDRPGNLGLSIAAYVALVVAILAVHRRTASTSGVQ